MAKLDSLFDELVNRGGGDLHVAPGAPPLARMRGDLVILREGQLRAEDVEDMLLEILTPGQRTALERSLELRIAYEHKDAARFRASYFREQGGLGAVFRLVPPRVPSLAELACPEALWRLADRRAGLVVVGGPAGSGRSTTLAAMIDHINKTRSCHVLSIEDPIEIVHDPLRAQITQREVGTHASSFEAALRSAVRENPDVVLVSDLSTNEVTRLALELAASGVLVFAAVEANGAVAAIERLALGFTAEAQPSARGLLADCLVGVVAQQLVRSSDAKTKVAAHEILVVTPPVALAIREDHTASLAGVIESGQAQGMQSMDVALERLVAAGRVDAQRALARAFDRDALAQAIGRARPDLADKLS